MKPLNKIKIAGISLLTAIVFGSIGASAIANSSIEAKAAYSPSATYTNGDGATYYNGISSAATGDTLLSSLQTLNNSKRKTLVGYSNMGTSPSGAFSYTDYDPSTVQTDSKGQKYGTKILSFYSGTSTTSWNREHVWPNSHGGGSGGSVSSPYVDSDIHMPRPTISSENSNRGNSFYVEGMSHSSNGWDPVTAFGESNCYGGKSVRGECARIIFYCMVADSDLKLADSATVSSNSGCTMGKLSDMLKWNLENPVNAREINRNEGAEYLQGNRNPFVDHPEYACKIWGNTNAATKAICGNAATDTRTMTKITVTSTDSSNYYVSENHYITLKATATYSDSSTADITSLVTWTSANSSYATVDQTGKVTGVAGSASGQYVNITATYGSLSGTHGVSVWTDGDYGTAINTGSGGTGSTEGVVGDILATDLATSYETSDTLHTAASGIKFYTNYCANFGSGIQFKKSQGYLYNAEAITLDKVTITNPSGGTLSVYGGTSISSITKSITGSNNVYDLSGYTYFKICAGSSASYCSAITITSKSSTPVTPEDSISLDKTSLAIETGSTGTILATSSGNVTWKSSNTSVATVSASGTNNVNATVTGISAGSTTITATCGSKSVTCNVTVTSKTPAVDEWPYENGVGYLMSFTSTSKNYFIGDTQTNYTWYGATSENVDDAAIMYFEDNSNAGHNLYCYRNSVKTYIQVVLSGTHINFDMTTSEPSTGWIYSDTYSTILFPISGTNYSIGSYSTYTTFSASTPDKTAYKADFELILTAEDFAFDFLDCIKCSGDGSILFDQVDWNVMKLEFEGLVTSAKNALKNANANAGGTIIEQCVARYDAIVAKYSSYEDYMSRGVSKSNKALSMVKDNTSFAAIVTVSLIAAVTAISFVVTKKKIGE